MKYKALVDVKVVISNIKTFLTKGEVYEIPDADAKPLLRNGYISNVKAEKKKKVKVED